MLIKEYRIPFPCTLAEYRVGMLYMISRATDEENRASSGSDIISVVKREKYYDNVRGVYGVYTEKLCHVRNLLPFFIKVFIPPDRCVLVEKAWNAFPYHCLTLYEAPFFGDNFHLSIESTYVQEGHEFQHNAFNVDERELDLRQVVTLNIASDQQLHMPLDADVRKFRPKSTSRPILDEDGIWMRTAHPIMHCYKLCRFDFNVKGMPGRRIEKWGHKHGLEYAFLRFNRQVFCWMDSWFGLDIADVDNLAIARPKTHHRGPIKPIKKAVAAITTEIAAETSAGLAFAISDETNPFCS